MFLPDGHRENFDRCERRAMENGITRVIWKLVTFRLRLVTVQYIFMLFPG